MLRSAASQVMWVGRATVFLIVGLAVILALWLVLVAQPADAAFPGKNGRIFFQSDRDGNPHIYSMNPDGTALSRLTFTGSNLAPAVSPDGTHIAFVGSGDIWVMNADGSGRRQLTHTNSAEQDPTWSPDGTRIAYASNTFATDGQTDTEILILNADGSGTPTQITSNTYPDTAPAWSIPLPGAPLPDAPDGMIAFVSTRPGDTDRNIYLMHPDGTGQFNLTPSGQPHGDTIYQGHDDDPTWTPYGRIAYVHTFEPNATGRPTIWAMNADGSTKSRLSANGAVAFTMPAWSPDGTRLAFVGAVTTNRNIWVMNDEGSGENPIDTHPAHDINPDWQQDSIPPQTTITSGPSGMTKSTSASFGFTSNEVGSKFECSFDGASFAACASPKSYPSLKDGSHTFKVRAIDAAGNVDATPAARSWTVDTIKPTVSGMSPRHKSITRDTTPIITATVKDRLTNLQKRNIKLYVNGKLISATKYSYSAAIDKLRYNSPNLGKGKKTVKIVATDAAKNVGTKSWFFTIK